MPMAVAERRYHIYLRRLQRWTPELELVAVRLHDAARGESADLRPARNRFKEVRAAFSCAVGRTETAYKVLAGNQLSWFEGQDRRYELVLAHLIAAARDRPRVADLVARLHSQDRDSDRGATRVPVEQIARSAARAHLAAHVAERGSEYRSILDHTDETVAAYQGVLRERASVFEHGAAHDPMPPALAAASQRLQSAIEAQRSSADAQLARAAEISAPSHSAALAPTPLRQAVGEYTVRQWVVVPENTPDSRPSSGSAIIPTKPVTRRWSELPMLRYEAELKRMSSDKVKRLLTELRKERENASSIAATNAADERLLWAEYRLDTLGAGPARKRVGPP